MMRTRESHALARLMHDRLALELRRGRSRLDRRRRSEPHHKAVAAGVGAAHFEAARAAMNEVAADAASCRCAARRGSAQLRRCADVGQE